MINTKYDSLIVAQQDAWGLPAIFKGTATGGSTTTIIDTGNLVATKYAAVADDVFNDKYAYIISGTAIDECRQITDFVLSTSTLTVSPAFSGTPDGNFIILEYPMQKSTVDSATSTTIVDAALTQADDYWNGWTIHITGGTGKGQTRYVSDFVAATDTLTVLVAFDVTPDSTSTFILFKGIFPIPIAGEMGRGYNDEDYSSNRINQSHAKNAMKEGHYSYTHDIPIEMTAEGLGVLLRALLPDYTFTAGSPNTHAHTETETAADFTRVLRQGLTLESGSELDSVYAVNDSAAVNELSFSFSGGEVIGGSISLISRELDEQSFGLPFYPPQTNRSFTSFRAEIKVGTDASEVIQSIRGGELTISAPKETSHDLSVFTAKKYMLGDIEITGSFDIDQTESTRTALETARTNKTVVSLIITLTSDIMAISSSPYTLVIDIPEITYDFGKGGSANKSDRIEAFNFKAGLSSGTRLVTVTESNMLPTLAI